MKQAGEVVLTGVPARLFLESQNHQQDLVRELALIDIADRYHEHEAPLPVRVALLIKNILDEYGDVRAATRQQVVDALSRGQDHVDLLVPIRDGISEALQQWINVVEDADELCTDETLLTLAASPEVRAFRRWYAEAVRAAIASGAPIAYPE